MAHPEREHFVKQLRPRLPKAEVVWDERNDRWDTGRRALLAFKPNANWHMVVQDDAVLCRSFLPGVRQALAAVPASMPVSFYVGKTQPYGKAVADAVQGAEANGQRWITMRGPLWGVAVAIPVHLIEGMVADCDLVNTPNYDMRMSEWFTARNIKCWYSVPSLADHRVGSDNPSLVPGRVSTAARTAHSFIGEADPRKLDWATDAYWAGDPTEFWGYDNTCNRCGETNDSVASAITHACVHHGLGQVDFLASTRHHAVALTKVMDSLPEQYRGRLYLIGTDLNVPVPFQRVKRSQAAWKIGPGPFTVCGALRDLRFLKERAAWSLDGVAN